MTEYKLVLLLVMEKASMSMGNYLSKASTLSSNSEPLLFSYASCHGASMLSFLWLYESTTGRALALIYAYVLISDLVHFYNSTTCRIVRKLNNLSFQAR